MASSLQDLLSWPLQVGQVLQPEQRKNLELLLSDGALGHSDYSGKRCMESSFAMMSKGWRMAGVRVPGNVFAWWRMSDSSKVCQRLALATKTIKPLHVFQDVMDRVPAQHRAALTALRPGRVTPKSRGWQLIKSNNVTWTFMAVSFWVGSLWHLALHMSVCVPSQCRNRDVRAAAQVLLSCPRGVPYFSLWGAACARRGLASASMRA